MGLLSTLFGESEQATQARTRSSRTVQADRDATRREVLVTAVRDTLRKHGIPPAWVSAETLTAAVSGRQLGMHLRLIVRHWEPRLLLYTVAIQNNVRARIAVLDPLSSEWLAGISWKLEIADESVCPALPDAGYWQRLVSNPPAQAADAKADAPAAPPRALLERLLGSGDSAAGKPRHDRPDFSPTQPMADIPLPDAGRTRVAAK